MRIGADTPGQPGKMPRSERITLTKTAHPAHAGLKDRDLSQASAGRHGIRWMR